MKYINKYADLAAYTADTNRPLDSKTVSKVANEMRYEDQNTVMAKEFATVGDSFVYDTTDATHKVVKLGTLNIATLGSNFIIGGTVSRRESKMIYIDGNTNLGSYQWGAPYAVKLSGFDLATGGSFTITINTTTTATITYTTSDTLATITTKMQDAIRVIMTIATWTVTAYDTYVVVRQSSYTPNVTIFTINDGDSKITRQILTGNYQTALTGVITPYGFVRRNDGVQSSFAGSNYEKFLSYYSVSGGTEINQTVGASTIVRESVFNTADNPLLVARYNTYRNYIADKMPRYPFSKGVIIDNQGKFNTNALAAITYTDHDGSTQPAFPAAFAAKSHGIATAGHTTGFEAGNWYLDSFSQKNLIIKDVTYGLTGITLTNMDALNKGIYAARGNTTHLISVNTSQWSSSEYSSHIAWYYHGANGRMHANIKNHSISVRVSLAFPL